ncbi:MAG: DegT/DnrJ/EryC1/StrS family aminotransferase [Chloroflexota bacterium]
MVANQPSNPQNKQRGPFPAWPVYDESEVAAVTQVLESRQWWRGNGSQVENFEQVFAAYHKAKRAVAVTNGTHAIELALMAAGIGHGDEVIVPDFTFISTASAVLCVNAIPILVDVKADTYCIDPAAIEAAITPRTRAIIPVHMCGQFADMDAILEIARKHDLVVIEDAAHAQGAEWQGRRAGTLGLAGTFSFQAFKLMTAGEGGMIISNDEEFIQRSFLYGNCGRPLGDRAYQHVLLGSNCRMSEIHAAVLRVQLERLDDQIERRDPNARLLDQMLSEVPGIEPQAHDPRTTRHPHYMYMFRYDTKEFGGMSRNEFVDALVAQGIPAFRAYLAIHRTPLFQQGTFGPRWKGDGASLPDYSKVHCPVTDGISDEAVWLHHRVLLGDQEDVIELAEAIKDVREHALGAGSRAVVSR